MNNKNSKIAKVNQETCIGCGVCASLAPELFELNDEGKAQATNGQVDEKAEDAKNACPVQAISIE